MRTVLSAARTTTDDVLTGEGANDDIDLDACSVVERPLIDGLEVGQVGINTTTNAEAAETMLDLANCLVVAPDFSEVLSDTPAADDNSPDLSTPATASSLMRDLMAMTLPLLAVWLSSPLLSLIDTAAVGRAASTLDLAALGPATSLCDTGSYILGFVSIVTTNLVATAVSQGDDQEATRVVADGIRAATVVGACFSLALVLPSVGGNILRFIMGGGSSGAPLAGDSLRVFATAMTYARIRAIAFIPALASSVCQAACLARKDVRLPLIAVALSSVLNLAGDWLLVMKFGMAAAGAAWATVAAQVVAFAVLLRNEHMVKQRALRGPRLDLDKPLAEGSGLAYGLGRLGRFFKLCIPPALALAGKAVTLMGLTGVVSLCGTAAMAAHQVLYALYCLFCPLGEALNQMVQTLLPSALVPQDEATRALIDKGELPEDFVDRRLTGPALALVKAVGATAVATSVLGAVGGTLLPRFAPQLFTTCPAVMGEMVRVAPLLGSCLGLFCLSTAMEGTLFATRDSAFLGLLYPIMSLGCTAAFSVLKQGSPSLSGVWTVFVGFNFLRLIQFAMRIAWNQRPPPVQGKDTLARYRRRAEARLALNVGVGETTLMDEGLSVLENLLGAGTTANSPPAPAR